MYVQYTLTVNFPYPEKEQRRLVCIKRSHYVPPLGSNNDVFKDMSNHTLWPCPNAATKYFLHRKYCTEAQK